MGRTIFSAGVRSATWENFLSLTPGSQVDVAVIDAWAAVLNFLEHSKPRSAPSRHFASTFTTLTTVVDTSRGWEQRVVWFRERLMMDLRASPYENITAIDMIFFPILRCGHYFLLCFDFVRGRYEIIDNDSYPTAKVDKYGGCVDVLKAILFEFFEAISPSRATVCAGAVSKRLQMGWRDSKNKINCGIFLMRHMETYVGQRVRDWECGLVKGDYTVLHKLRLRYMNELVTSQCNVMREDNLARAYQSILVQPPST
ncbi:PREDICTED: uncharacterized protein LOC109159949 [Ipomoea nil]|uniref:uncharacterized protein LOC109159949 n=1 Tax=Ipomoea nil TaxID=35883 RepID=UPI0009017DEA|nr:PREDICTED: uncharacterized protein LOC109159949 [Ipomoea nil]